MSPRPLILKLVSALIGAAAVAAPLASRAETDSASVVKVDLTAGAAAQSLALPQGRSAVVELPIDARDVLVSNPQVAEAVLRTPRRIYVLGMRAGVSDAVFFDAAGRRILTLSIRVDQNTSALAETIERVIPDAHVKVEAINDSVILTGLVRSASDADKAVEIARATVANPSQVLNMLSIAGKDQVMLKVRIVELQRQVIKQLGLNWQTVINNGSSPAFALATTSTFGVNGALLGGVAASGLLKNKSGTNQLQGSLQAFERVGLVRTLAEPTLTAVSGESAKFLVGGEFPVPTSEDSTGKVSVEFKQFGIGLGFTPVVLSGGRISLKLSTEVSELSNQGSFSLSAGGSATLVIPSLTVRRAESMVELPSGGAMMIAGLLQDKTAENLDSIPGVKDVPILGALFRSRDFQTGQTELVVIVTPYLVTATNPSELQTPIDNLHLANDAETILLGRLNKAFKRAPEATEGKTYEGSYGYVVE